MYISASKFKQQLNEIGAKEYEITIKDDTETVETKREIRGFSIPQERLDSDVFVSLQGLGVITSFDLETGEASFSSGWVGVKDSDGNLMIMPESDFIFLDEGKLVKSLDGESYPKIKKSSEGSTLTISRTDINTSEGQNNGVAIVTSGNNGVYEMHKREMFAFLMKGMDVVGFNFRGYGESTGEPSEEGLLHDFRAVYDYVQEKHPVSDDKILLKAMCMSGGAAAAFAKEHPKANIMLDQSYSRIGEVIKDQAEEFLNEYMEDLQDDPDRGVIFKALVKWIGQNFRGLALAITKKLAPSWEVHKDLRNVEGRIGILSADDDTIMPSSVHMEKIYHSRLKNRRGLGPMCFSMQGKHGDSWVDNFQPVIRGKSRMLPNIVVDKYSLRFNKLKEKFIEYDKGMSTLKTNLREINPFFEQHDVYDELMEDFTKKLEAIKKNPEFVTESQKVAAIKELLMESEQIRQIITGSVLYKYNQDYIDEAIEDFANKTANGFSAGSAQKFYSIYYALKSSVDEFDLNKITPEKLLKQINLHFAKLGENTPEMRELYQDFILDAFGLETHKLIDHPELFVSKYLARNFMDHFLQSAKLGGLLWSPPVA
jgi:pimeloyl-ACP methyl ester carboxylesterase